MLGPPFTTYVGAATLLCLRENSPIGGRGGRGNSRIGRGRNAEQFFDSGEATLHFLESVFEEREHALCARNIIDICSGAPLHDGIFQFLRHNQQLIDTDAPFVPCVSAGRTSFSAVERDDRFLRREVVLRIQEEPAGFFPRNRVTKQAVVADSVHETLSDDEFKGGGEPRSPRRSRGVSRREGVR